MKGKRRAEKSITLKTKMNKPKHKLRQVQTEKYVVPKLLLSLQFKTIWRQLSSSNATDPHWRQHAAMTQTELIVCLRRIALVTLATIFLRAPLKLYEIYTLAKYIIVGGVYTLINWLFLLLGSERIRFDRQKKQMFEKPKRLFRFDMCTFFATLFLKSF